MDAAFREQHNNAVQHAIEHAWPAGSSPAADLKRAAAKVLWSSGRRSAKGLGSVLGNNGISAKLLGIKTSINTLLRQDPVFSFQEVDAGNDPLISLNIQLLLEKHAPAAQQHMQPVYPCQDNQRDNRWQQPQHQHQHQQHMQPSQGRGQKRKDTSHDDSAAPAAATACMPGRGKRKSRRQRKVLGRQRAAAAAAATAGGGFIAHTPQLTGQYSTAARGLSPGQLVLEGTGAAGGLSAAPVAGNGGSGGLQQALGTSLVATTQQQQQQHCFAAAPPFIGGARPHQQLQNNRCAVQLVRLPPGSAAPAAAAGQQDALPVPDALHPTHGILAAQGAAAGPSSAGGNELFPTLSAAAAAAVLTKAQPAAAATAAAAAGGGGGGGNGTTEAGGCQQATQLPHENLPGSEHKVCLEQLPKDSAADNSDAETRRLLASAFELGTAMLKAGAAPSDVMQMLASCGVAGSRGAKGTGGGG